MHITRISPFSQSRMFLLLIWSWVQFCYVKRRKTRWLNIKYPCPFQFKGFKPVTTKAKFQYFLLVRCHCTFSTSAEILSIRLIIQNQLKFDNKPNDVVVFPAYEIKFTLFGTILISSLIQRTSFIFAHKQDFHLSKYFLWSNAVDGKERYELM